MRVLDDWTGTSEPLTVLNPPEKRIGARTWVFIDWQLEAYRRGALRDSQQRKIIGFGRARGKDDLGWRRAN